MTGHPPLKALRAISIGSLAVALMALAILAVLNLAL